MKQFAQKKRTTRKAVVYKGIVIKGDGVASRDFDVPTANLHFRPLPRVRYGIYTASVKVNGFLKQGIVSWGPGITRKFEVHLFDFTGDLVGKGLSVTLLKRVGEWVPWTSQERMRQKIWNDIAAAHEWFAEQKRK